MSRTYQFANVHILFIYVWKGMCMGMDVTVVVGVYGILFTTFWPPSAWD